MLAAFAAGRLALFNAFMPAFFALTLIATHFVVVVTVLVALTRFHDHIFSTPDNQYSEQNRQRYLLHFFSFRSS